METLCLINYLISVLFIICYSYQFFYIPVSLFFPEKKNRKDGPKRDLAILISARNEERVIGDLLDSIRDQDYPKDHIHVFVIADNCSDHTAEVASKHGAHVYTRHNARKIGKGYALDELLQRIRQDHPEGYDAYLVFDADNLLKEDYLTRMNESLNEGSIITGYRNSKNYGSNWISAGYALWFLRESRFLHHPRSLLHTSCNVSGTGFCFSREVYEELGGWPFHLLTEDIEFSIHEILKGRKIVFCEDAELYDEQPVTFAQSWRQRMRWSKGYLQVFRKYGKDLFLGMWKGSFSCFDMWNTIMPAFVLSAVSVLCNLTLSLYGGIAGEDMMIALSSIGEFVLDMYGMLYGIGLVTTITEWKKIHASSRKKILYTFTVPLFMFTYIPISFASLFVEVSWKPIEHSFSADRCLLNEVRKS